MSLNIGFEVSIINFSKYNVVKCEIIYVDIDKMSETISLSA